VKYAENRKLQRQNQADENISRLASLAKELLRMKR